MRPFAIVVLAAGGSSRLGQPKQLLNVGDVPLVRRSVDTALSTGARQVVVVLGAHAERVREACGEGPIEFVMNDQWEEGMGSSVRAGVAAIDVEAEVVVLALCDQPHVTGDLLIELASSIDEDAPIGACMYRGVPGAPCAFHRSMFADLLKLEGDRGARDIIRDPSRVVRLIPFEPASIDVDLPADLAALRGL